MPRGLYGYFHVYIIYRAEMILPALSSSNPSSPLCPFLSSSTTQPDPSPPTAVDYEAREPTPLDDSVSRLTPSISCCPRSPWNPWRLCSPPVRFPATLPPTFNIASPRLAAPTLRCPYPPPCRPAYRLHGGPRTTRCPHSRARPPRRPLSRTESGSRTAHPRPGSQYAVAQRVCYRFQRTRVSPRRSSRSR